ncbi:MAG: hypothetical protein V4714_22430 [Bacteroidota bacterium]
MNYYLGGYYLVKQNDFSHWKGVKPKPTWTISNCINDVHPDEWAFDWVETSVERKLEVQKTLAITDDQYQEIQRWVSQKDTEDKFGWPNLFRDREAARQFASQYLFHLTGIKLLGIYLPEYLFADFIADIQPANNYPGTGIYQQLNQKVLEDGSGEVLGFDILGIEYSGDFHCFLCNCLEKAYQDQFELTFNSNGLIDSLEDAQQVLDYTNAEETGAEPVPWAIWKVKEF